jgi:hypothetical protein
MKPRTKLAQEFNPAQRSYSKGQQQKGENKMKKLLFIALVAVGCAFVPIQQSGAQVTVGIGGVGVGVGYPGYRYGYYPYGGYGYGSPYSYYRPSYSYYSGPSYYYRTNKYYRHHRHHYRY